MSTLSNPDDIEQWLVGKLSSLLHIKADRVDPEERFSRMGLESKDALLLVTELSAALGRELSPTFIWEQPTIRDAVRFLVQTAPTKAISADSKRAPVPASMPQTTVANDPVAIVGLACRFPKASDAHRYWSNLCSGVNAITEVPQDRWNVADLFDPDPQAVGYMSTKWGGFLDNIDQFDPTFFGISLREAQQMDPQQRLMLEMSWAALEDAGFDPSKLRGSRTGVYVGVMWNDYVRTHARTAAQVVPYTATGQDLSIITGRVSYILGLQGPSVAILSACSSSLVAVHLACQAIRGGDCDMALAGGVNIILTPDNTMGMCRLGMMAPDGLCKAFDASANGYVRSEGAGIVALKPLSQALADGDPIYCVIRGSAANNDGYSNGLTAPNPLAQVAVLRDAYARAGIHPNDVHYVETHGPGTLLGDPIEAGALKEVLSGERPDHRKLILGSCKTHLGHMESAAGIGGLIKTSLAIAHRTIPANLHFNAPNPHIPFDAWKLQVAQALQPWPYDEEPASAGVSSFGFGGTNCHIVLQEAPRSHANILPLSADSEDDLEKAARDLKSFVSSSAVRPSLSWVAQSAAVRHAQRQRRVAFVSTGYSDLIKKLEKFLQGTEATGVTYFPHHDGTCRVVFVFSGQGGHWPGMGRMLLREQPIFRSTLARCHEMLLAMSGFSLMKTLTQPGQRPLPQDILQPTIVALQCALSTLLSSWGIKPHMVLGHSLGEIAAAYTAGILSLRDTMLVAVCRSRLMARLAGTGAVILVECDAVGLERLLPSQAGVEIAAHNDPQGTVVAGPSAAIAAFAPTLTQEGIAYRAIPSDVAFHTSAMNALRAELITLLAGIQPHKGAIPFVSTVTGTPTNGKSCSPAYWARNLREPVLFSQAIETACRTQPTAFVELGPHPVLTRSIARICAKERVSALTTHTMQRSSDELETMFDTLATLYTLGADVRWSSVFADDTAAAELPLSIAFGPQATESEEPQPRLCVLSGHTDGALKDRARDLVHHLQHNSGVSLRHICYTLAARRMHHGHRLAVVARDRTHLAAQLSGFVGGAVSPTLRTGRPQGAPPRLVFVFSGTGSDWIGMGVRLLRDNRVFAEKLEEIDAALLAKERWTIIPHLTAPSATSRLGEVDLVQPAVFAIQVGIATLWRAWGVEPAAVVGHSMGEVAAAHVAGALTLEDALTVITARSQLAKQLAGRGRMALVGLDPTEASTAIAQHQDSVSIAALNGPTSTVLSGDPAALQQVVTALEGRQVRCHWVRTDIAFHSMQTEALTRPLRERVESLQPRLAVVPFYSTVTGARSEGLDLDADYWARNLRQTVRFAPVVADLIADGMRDFLEIAPHPILAPSIREALRRLGQQGCVLSSWQRDAREDEQMLESLGELYTLGYPITWQNVINGGGRVVSLPPYPWQTVRCWIGEGDAAPKNTKGKSGKAPQRTPQPSTRHPMLGWHVRYPSANGKPPSTGHTMAMWEVVLGPNNPRFVADHVIEGAIVLPATAHLEIALAAAQQVIPRKTLVLTNIRFDKALFLTEEEEIIARLVLMPLERGDYRFSLFTITEVDGKETWTCHSTGTITNNADEQPDPMDFAGIEARCDNQRSQPEHYTLMNARHIRYGTTFQSVQTLRWNTHEAFAHIEAADALIHELGRYHVHPALHDACLQIMYAHQPAEGSAYLPVHIERLVVYRSLPAAIVGHVTQRSNGAGIDSYTGDLRVCDMSGNVCIEATGMRFQRLDATSSHNKNAWLYTQRWIPTPRADDERPAMAQTGAWVVFGDPCGIAAALLQRLGEHGHPCVTVTATRPENAAPDPLCVNPAQPRDFHTMLQHVRSQHGGLRGIVYLWPIVAQNLDDDARRRQRDASDSALIHLLAALAQQPDAPDARVWLVTQGAQRLDTDKTPVDFCQSTVWGIGRCAALEHPSRWGAAIDLPADADATTCGGLLFDELIAPDAEDQLLLRRSGRFGLRLVKGNTTARDAKPFRCRPDASYLITGGLGGLGFQLANWLFDKGARRLILTGRTPLPPRSVWDSYPSDGPLHPKIEQICALEARGASVWTAHAPAHDRQAMATLLREAGATLPPIRGIVHAAAAFANTRLTELDPAAHQAMTQPKADGAWTLHALSEALDLDFFVLFSSAASVWGGAGLASYAAANAFLDALAHLRVQQRKPVVCVNWAMWGGAAGISAQEAQKRSFLAQGLVPMPPADALEILERQLAGETPHAVVAAMDWPLFTELYPSRSDRHPLLEDIRRTLQQKERQEDVQTAAGQGPEPNAGDLQPETILATLGDMLAQTFGDSDGGKLDPRYPLTRLGLDSITAVELRNNIRRRYAIDLPITELLRGASLSDLSTRVYASLASEGEAH